MITVDRRRSACDRRFLNNILYSVSFVLAVMYQFSLATHKRCRLFMIVIISNITVLVELCCDTADVVVGHYHRFVAVVTFCV